MTSPRRSSRTTVVDPVRLAAVEVLEQWLHGRGHAEDLVERLERKGRFGIAQWNHPDRRRLREIVFGCVRLRARYDHVVDRRRDARKAPPPRLRALLHVALHEMGETRTPDHAVVDQAVEATRALRLEWASGFVNAVLRAVAREGIDTGFVPADSDPIEHACTWLSHPRWLVEHWAQLLGPAEMLELCEANNRRPTLHLRAAPGRREELRAALASFEWEARAVPVAPDALELLTRVPPGLLLDQIAEPCALQDAAAQLVAPLLADALAPDATILDLCAAPGGKATHLAQLLGASGRVVAVDASPSRLRRMSGAIDRLALRERVHLAVTDGARPGLPEGAFDGVLVDAPCTGTGVLARRHEARWERREADLEEMPRLQTALLRRALDLVRPGGIVVYATCSLESEENDEVVDTVLSEREDAEEIGVGQHLPDAFRRGDRLQTWPHRHGLDGAFAARIRRKSP